MQSKYHCKNRRKYNLKVHIVIVTKYRKKLLTGGLDLFLKKACAYIAKQRSWEIVAMETDKDHIHILLEYDTTECVCNIVSILKRQTTYYLWARYKDYLSTLFWEKHIFWSDGYFACSIGEVSTATIQKYIKSQG